MARTHAMTIAVLRALREDLSHSLREAAAGTDRKARIGRAWDHLLDAQAILRDIDLIERQRQDNADVGIPRPGDQGQEH